MSSGTRCGRIDCEVRTEGVVTGRVRSLSSRSGQALCWPRIAEIPLQGLTSAIALVLCIHTGVSELLAHDEWGGPLSPQERHFLRPEDGAELPQQGQSRVCVSQTTAVCKAGVGQDWGHTPIWTGHGRGVFTSKSVSLWPRPRGSS